jgi:hypothetical protein
MPNPALGSASCLVLFVPSKMSGTTGYFFWQ